MKSPGTTTDIVNLRKREGVWEPISKKVRSSFFNVFGQPVYPVRLLGIHQVIGDTVTILEGNSGELLASINGVVVTLDNGFQPGIVVDFINNILIAYNLGEKPKYFIYNNEAYSNYNLALADFDITHNDAPYQFSGQSYTIPTVLHSISMPAAPTDEQVNAAYFTARADVETKGVLTGSSWWCFTLVLFDGTEIMHSPIKRLNGATIYWERYGSSSGTKVKVVSYGHLSEGEVIFSLSGLGNIVTQSGIISGIKFYAVRPPAMGTTSGNAVKYINPHINYHENCRIPAYTARTFAEVDTFREMAFVSLKDLAETIHVKFPAIDVIDALPVLPLDSNTHHSLRSHAAPLTYNSRLLLCDISTHFGTGLKGFRFDKYNADPLRSAILNENNVMFEYNTQTYTGPDIALSWTASQKKRYIGIIAQDMYVDQGNTFIIDNQFHYWNGTGWQSSPATINLTWQLFFRYSIKTQQGTLIVDSPIYNLTGAEWSWSGNYKQMHVDSLITYPDSRVTSVNICCKPLQFNGVDVNAPGTWYCSTHEMKSSDVNNYSYAEVDVLFVSPDDGAQLPGITSEVIADYGRADSYREQNRIQASEVNNIFLFPSKNSYSIGNTKIMRLSTIREELSAGQFGRFPIVAFTSSGLWSLEIGQGVFISSVAPLAQSVCTNPSAILAVKGGLFFPAADGLKVLVGAELVDISDEVKGIPVNESYLHISHIAPNRMEVDFREYIKTAVFGYDYALDELILSNAENGLSFIYSFTEKEWSLSTLAYQMFLNQFPYAYGCNTEGAYYNVYDLSQEQNKEVQVSFTTNKFGEEVYTKLEEIALRGSISKGIMQVYASTDGRTFYLMSVTRCSESSALFGHRLNFSAKYYIVAFSGELDSSNFLSHLELNSQPRYNRKLR